MFFIGFLYLYCKSIFFSLLVFIHILLTELFIHTLLTFFQILKKKRHSEKKKNSILGDRPQISGVVTKVRIATPRKPNSARRPVVKVLLSNKKQRVVHVPGKGHNLRKHSEVLVSGVGARDLPGVHYSCIRGVYDLVPVSGKTRRRSIYGVKRPDILKKKLRRKFRVS